MLVIFKLLGEMSVAILKMMDGTWVSATGTTIHSNPLPGLTGTSLKGQKQRAISDGFMVMPENFHFCQLCFILIR